MEDFYVDDDIKIDEKELTPLLRKSYKDILKYRKKKDVVKFTLEWEFMEVMSRQAISSKQISEEVYLKIRHWLGFGD